MCSLNDQFQTNCNKMFACTAVMTVGNRYASWLCMLVNYLNRGNQDAAHLFYHTDVQTLLQFEQSVSALKLSGFFLYSLGNIVIEPV